MNTVVAQEKEPLYTCTELNYIEDKAIVDSLPNGKKVSAIMIEDHPIYLVKIKDKDSFYYVTKPLMKKIRKSKRKNACKEVQIIRLEKETKRAFRNDKELKEKYDKRKRQKQSN